MPDLSALAAGLYEQGGYDMLIDYGKPPRPPTLSQAGWWQHCCSGQKRNPPGRYSPQLE